METNLQTNYCYNCSKPLSQTGYFCGGCLIQVRCKSCDSLLEKDDAGCVNCGTPKEVRGATKAGSQQNVNTFRLHETATDRTIEATFSDDVAKDIAGTLRDAAAAGRMKAISASFPPANDFNGASKEIAEFADAEVVNNENGVSTTEAIHKPASTTNTAKQEEYPSLIAIAMNNLPSSETEWVVVYAFYASNYGKEIFSREDLLNQYKDAKRYNKQTTNRNLSIYIKRAVNAGFINPLQSGYSLLSVGTGKAKEIISRTSSSSPKTKASSKIKKGNEDNAPEDDPANNKRISKSSTSKTVKRLSNINFEPTGKESLKDFMSKYAPKSDKERNLLFTHYLNNILKVNDITFDHIYSCYDVLDLPVSINLSQTVRNTSSKTGWIEIKDSKIYETIKGGNQIKAWNK